MKKILLTTTALPLLALSFPAMAFSPAGEDIAYRVNDEDFQGYFVSAADNAKGSVLIVHDWDGLDDYERQRADMLADEGYDVFAVDLLAKATALKQSRISAPRPTDSTRIEKECAR
ncbi:hypothetical protein HORIV_35840 [Vreelandella olivaria]|uniref:Dienelactone hydrolase domain-containing protein n=1 Tax=Vreelandella olivaria TaxID=390919 RepID=A0ABN5X245_9GAMM|nr:hypothetical protein HORIV_35840 [Halomonas olivaria]